MTQSPNFHALPYPGYWVVRRQGSKKAAKRHAEQATAWTDAQERAARTGGTAYLFDKSGQIVQRVNTR